MAAVKTCLQNCRCYDVPLKQSSGFPEPPFGRGLKAWGKKLFWVSVVLNNYPDRRNLVQFYGACITEGNLMLVLEYMDGQPFFLFASMCRNMKPGKEGKTIIHNHILPEGIT
jgi:hypothetical protein